MSVRSAQSITVLFTTRVWSTGVGTNADSLPTGTLYVNGTANGATVTVTNISAGLYKAQVTLPTLAVGDEVEIAIAATVSSIADTAVIWGDTKDIAIDGSGDVTFNNTTLSGNVGGIAGTLSTLDQLAATAAAANVTQVNGHAVTGAGTAGNPWGPV